MADLTDLIVTRVRDGQPNTVPVLTAKDLLPRGRSQTQTLESLRDDLLVRSGSYVPTITETTNIAVIATPVARFIRIGDIVHVTGTVSVDPTLAAPTATVIGISLPIASNFAATTDGGGLIAGVDAAGAGSIVASIANDRVDASWDAADAGAIVYGFSFSYAII